MSAISSYSHCKRRRRRSGRDVKLLVQISPPILTNVEIKDAYVLFRLYDVNTNQTIKFTSLFLSIIKDGKELVHPDLFHSAEGILKLKIQPSPGETVIYANKEPHLDAWQADPGGIINLKGPILLEGGLYRIHVEIFGIDSPLEIFPESKIPKYDVYLSVGDIYNNTVQYGGQRYNTTIVSYYDKVQDFSFDSENKEVVWSMPFNYDLRRIENESDIFVHEEVRLPWPLADILSNTTFTGTVDGTRLPASSLVIDPYSSNSELFIHFLINKEQLVRLAKESDQIDKLGTMKFALSATKLNEVETSTRIFTDTGNIMVLLDWNPSQLAANVPVKLHLAFYDQATGKPILADVKYDASIFSSGIKIPERTPIISRENLVASNGTDTIENIIFPANGIYDMQVDVRGISAPTPDSSRTGRALGPVVVPEFENALALVMVISIIGGMTLARYFGKFRLESRLE